MRCRRGAREECASTPERTGGRIWSHSTMFGKKQLHDALAGGGAVIIATAALLAAQSIYPGGETQKSPYLPSHDIHNQIGIPALAGYERAMLVMAEISRRDGNIAAADGYLRYGAVNLAGVDILLAYARRCEESPHPGGGPVVWYRRAKMLAEVQGDKARAAVAARELDRLGVK